MKWSAQSPDLNPIENVWGLMKTHLRKRNVNPRNPMELFHILSTMWNSLPDDYFHKFSCFNAKACCSSSENQSWPHQILVARKFLKFE